MRKKLFAGLCAAVMLLALLPAAHAEPDGGTVLYHRLAPSSVSEVQSVWPTNTTSVFMNSCTIDGETWQQAAYYNNYSASSGGLPDGQTLCVTVPNVSIPTQGYEDVALTLRYGACPQNGDAGADKYSQFQVYASTDGGATWSEKYAGLYSHTVNGLGHTSNDLDAWVYTAVSTDLACLVPAGAVINALKIRPIGDNTYRGGAIRFQEITVTGYAQARPIPDGSVPGPVLDESFDHLPADSGLPIGVVFTNHLLNGGAADALVRQDVSGRYLELSAHNTSSSTSAARSRIGTARRSSGTFTVQWDYRRESPVRFDCFLRKNAEAYVMVAASGSVGLNVLSSALVPGVMESQDCKLQMAQGKWYTFKASVSDTVIDLDIYDRATGARVGGAILPQDTTNAPSMLDPAAPSFDVWAYDKSNTETATAGLDNVYVVSGWYEGLHEPEEYEDHVFDHVTFAGSGGTLTVDNFSLDTQDAVNFPIETFNGGTLPEGWSGQATLTAGAATASLRAALRGKTVSFLGDSISTYKGWSNNTDFNPTMGGNSIFYPSTQSCGGWLTDPEQTWWLRSARLSGMDLLVNNSYSGDKLNRAKSGKGLDRCVQLHHADGRKPDAIVVLFGTNDAVSTSTSVIDQFKVDYEEMITSIRAAYPQAELFLCEILPRTGMTKYQYNKRIRTLAAQYGVRLIETSACGAKDMETNYLDGLHPTPAGMELISAQVVEALGDWAGKASRGKALTLTDGTAEYSTELQGTTADLIFDCKVSGSGTYTVSLGSSDQTTVELPLEGLEQDTWYTVRIRTNGTKGELVTEVTKAPTVDTVETEPGDFTGDGKVNAKDIVLLQRFIAGGYGVTVDESAADLTGDGKVNAKDIVLLQRFVAGGYGVTL